MSTTLDADMALLSSSSVHYYESQEVAAQFVSDVLKRCWEDPAWITIIKLERSGDSYVVSVINASSGDIPIIVSSKELQGILKEGQDG